MLKKKYFSLNKDERKKLKIEFYQTDFGKSINTRLNRLFIIGVLCFLFSVILFIWPSNKWDIVTGFILVISSILFVGGSFNIRIDKLNNYLIKKKK